MNEITAEREAVAALIARDDRPAVAFVPAPVSPPLAMVLPGSPYLEGGETFGSKTLRIDVWLVYPGATDNAATGSALDTEITRTVAALEADDIFVESVEAPALWQPNSGGSFLYTVISARLEISSPTEVTS